ncbi:MAG: transglutaminase domain-containing protein [Thiomargarita sp.]|nr:transglutaminase domain-containing protein [Thiomargarita sp.]
MIRSSDYWNNKWRQAPITYGGRALRGSTERIVCDVKNFVTANDAILDEIIHDYRLKRNSHNATAQAIQKFVVSFLGYLDDEEGSECPEFWQFPFESLQSGVGDCEDGAILIASLMIQSGIPSYRVKVCAGYVQEAQTAPQGGHAYCIYLADRSWNNQNWVVLDWCYYEDSETAPENKPLAKEGGYNGVYGELWFTFNNEYSWNQSNLEIDARRISRNRSAPLKEEFPIEMSLESVMTKIKKKVVFNGE